MSSHCLGLGREPPSPELLTQHIELLFVRGFPHAGVPAFTNLLRLHPRVNVVPGPGNFRIISNALRDFVAPPHIASEPEYMLTTKRWYLNFVRSFMLTEVPLDYATDYTWAAESAMDSLNPVIPSASYLLAVRDGRGMHVIRGM